MRRLDKERGTLATATAVFFEELAQRGFEPALRTATGTVRFGITGEGSRWVAVNEGRLTVASRGSSVDCVCTAAAEVFVPMARGKLNPLAAALRGRIKIAGDTALALCMLRRFC